MIYLYVLAVKESENTTFSICLLSVLCAAAVVRGPPSGVVGTFFGPQDNLQSITRIDTKLSPKYDSSKIPQTIEKQKQIYMSILCAGSSYTKYCQLLSEDWICFKELCSNFRCKNKECRFCQFSIFQFLQFMAVSGLYLGEQKVEEFYILKSNAIYLKKKTFYY